METNNVNEKELATIRTSYDMYEETKKQTQKALKKALNPDGTRKYSDEKIAETISIIEASQSELCDKYKMLGGDPNDLKNRKNKPKVIKKNKNVFDKIIEAQQIDNSKEDDHRNDTITYKDQNISVNKFNEASIKPVYDVIPLPSNGECYKNKKGKIPVSYLTAYDENLIVSPNLYKDGTFIDYLLKEKIMNSNIDPLDLTIGDRDAIILWLRATGYGNDFPIKVNDDITGEPFDTIVDLSTIKYKDFKLKGDENGYFDFILPQAKDAIKFKFLTYRDEKNLQLIEEIEDKNVKKNKISNIKNDLDEIIKSDDEIKKDLKIKLTNAINTLEDWVEEIDKEPGLKFTHSITNRLEMSIVSINDITDRDFIKDYVLKMNVRDASALRKYINENEPGLDFNITIKKPESLGGGSMTMFLSLDQYIFLNIA